MTQRDHAPHEPTIVAWDPSLAEPRRSAKLLSLYADAGPALVIDFGGNGFLSSRVLALLLEIRSLAGRDGKTISLIVRSDTLRALFRVVGFDRFFRVSYAR